MRWLTADALVVCAHQLGKVGLEPSQTFCTVGKRPALVADDPAGRPIAGCPHLGPAIKPCTNTLKVNTGYSTLVRIGGRPVCLDTLQGFTDGTPPGIVVYKVDFAGQALVGESR